MARPKLGNARICVRLTPSVDAALVKIAEVCGLRSMNPLHAPIGEVCVDAFRRLAERYDLDTSEGWPEPLAVPHGAARVEAASAVSWVSHEVRSVTRVFTAPPCVVSLYPLLSTIAELPRYSTKIKWDAAAGEYVQATRRAEPPKSLVLWAAIVEYLDEHAKASAS